MSAQGVVVLRAKKRENGSMPSLAISCLTNPKLSVSTELAAGIVPEVSYLARL